MKIHQNDPEHIIDNPEDFCQYHSSLLSIHKGEYFIQQPSQLQLHNYMEDQTLMCSPTSNYSIISDLLNSMYKLSMVSKPLQNVLTLPSLKIPNTNIIIPLFYHIICEKNHKIQSVKLHSNIKMNSVML